jgi:plastocyanin
MRRVIIALVALVSVVTLVTACGSNSRSAATSTGGASAPAAANTIVIDNFMFSPMTLTVSPGATVTVKNQDSTAHTLTATTKQFDTGDIGAGATKTFTAPSKAGTYSYICDIHQYMQGKLTVK